MRLLLAACCLSVIFCPAIEFSAKAEPGLAKRIGPDLEDYNPPYDRSARTLARAIEAYDRGDDPTVERLARARLDELGRRMVRDPYAEIDARFLLARALEGQSRASEAESQYRSGLALLRPLVEALAGKPAPDRLARWVTYFDVVLRSNLSRQGRIREADLLVRLIPIAEPKDAKAERASVGYLPGIATTQCPGAALVVRSRTADEEQTRQSWQSLADHAFADDRASDAVEPLKQVLKLDQATAGPEHCLVELDYRGLGEAQFAAQDFASAAESARRVVALSVKLQPTAGRSPYGLHLLGRALARLGDPVGAEAALTEAVTIARRNAPDNEDTRQAQLDLAAHLVAENKLTEAEAEYRLILTGLERPYGTPDILLALDIRETIGYLADKQGRLGDAAEEYRRVCAARSELSTQTSRGSLASPTIGDAARAGDCAMRLSLALFRWASVGGGTAAGDRSDALMGEAFAIAQNALPSPSGEAFARAFARRQAGSSAALIDRYEEAVRNRDAAGLSLNPNWTDPRGFVSESSEHSAVRETLNREVGEAATALAATLPQYWEARKPRALDLSRLRPATKSRRSLLGADEALIYLMVPADNRMGLVFAVSREKAAWTRIGMTGADLRTAVQKLRREIDPEAYGVENAPEPDKATFDRELAYRLYIALLSDPLVREVFEPKRTIIVVPTGPLTSLPPAVLITHAPQGDDRFVSTLQATDWLLRSHAIAVLPSVTSLGLLRDPARKRGPGSEPLLAFANPSFTPPEDVNPQSPATSEKRGLRTYRSYFTGGVPTVEDLTGMPQLPDAYDEGLALAKVLKAPASAVLTGSAASKAALLSRNSDGSLAKVRVLEFATHGLVAGNGDGLSEPSLVLAATPRAEDWLLTASEAATLKLNTDWVLLSACNTASPDGEGAEGLSGLTRGFFAAGAKALLVSHWTVDDTAARLVPDVIALNRRGLSRAEALRKASLAVLDDTTELKANPYYWAAFTLIGEPN